MSTTHTLRIDNSDVIKQIETRTFKFGKARDAAAGDKLTNNVKLTDMPYDRSMVHGWIATAITNLRSAFDVYQSSVTYSYESGHSGEEDYKINQITFTLPNKWDSSMGDGFDNDFREYVINIVISDFLGLSLPKEAELYTQKAMQALKDAERKLYFKRA